jgi:hypothetical protein
MNESADGVNLAFAFAIFVFNTSMVAISWPLAGALVHQATRKASPRAMNTASRPYATPLISSEGLGGRKPGSRAKLGPLHLGVLPHAIFISHQ